MKDLMRLALAAATLITLINAQAQEPSNKCIVRKVVLTMSEYAFSTINMNQSHMPCGKIVHGCCRYGDLLDVGDSRTYQLETTASKFGVLAEAKHPDDQYFTCQKGEADSHFTIITWALLEDVFGYDAIKGNDIPPECRLNAVSSASNPPSEKSHPESGGPALNLGDNEKRLIIQALRESNNDITAASKKLGISGAALKRRLKESPVTTSQPPSVKRAAAESPNCIVHDLRFRVTDQAQRNTGESHGTVTHVSCEFNDTSLGEGERQIYYRDQTGVLSRNSTGRNMPAFICRRESDRAPVEISWPILEELYGYEAIKENKIPPECRLRQ